MVKKNPKIQTNKINRHRTQKTKKEQYKPEANLYNWLKYFTNPGYPRFYNIPRF